MENNATKKGIVYILINEVMPNVIKVGKTDRNDVLKRIKDLNGTNLPLSYECFHAREVEDMDFVEKQLHKILDDKRINPKREFLEQTRMKYLKSYY